MESSNAPGGGGGSSSSDFVRKLYKMLEDPANRDFVRWSETGDSFIVVDAQTNDFTKTILPQHFKHTNFASFVRQLNKYDFHKIRNTDESGANLYGEQAWEFKHPDFTMHNKNNLDNIRRKAPASKNKQQGETIDRQEIDQLHNRLQAVSDAHAEITIRVQRLSDQNNTFYTEFMSVLERLSTQESALLQYKQAISSILEHLQNPRHELLATKRLEARPSDSSENDGSSHTAGASPNAYNETSPTLQQAQQIMAHQTVSRPEQGSTQHGVAEMGAGYEFGGAGRHLQNGQRVMGGMPGPSSQYVHGPGPAGNGEMYHQENTQGGQLNYQPMPNNIIPPPAPRPIPGRKKSTPFNPRWATQPRVLLVEDDPTCARIGAKFLCSADCGCEVAHDGLQAINMLTNHKYDMVLMDIMMPNLDGCSAAALIRDFDQRTPIIAMTSNIRREEINTYFNNGMNDVLPKPFTKEGLLHMLERTLPHLMDKSAQPPPQIPPQASFDGADNRIIDTAPAAPMSANSLAYSASPAASRSPGTAGLYGPGPGPGHSPTDITEDPVAHSQTPTTVEESSGYPHVMGGYMEDSGHPHEHGSGYASPSNPGRGHRRGRSELEGADEGHMNYANPSMKKQRY